MKTYKLYDDIADAYVTIQATSLEDLIDIIVRDYGKAYLPHMHYEEEVTNHCRFYGMGGYIPV